jgi:hypothetical protein
MLIFIQIEVFTVTLVCVFRHEIERKKIFGYKISDVILYYYSGVTLLTIDLIIIKSGHYIDNSIP